MDPSGAASDPFCGTATYDGHDGVDIRLRSMRDVATGQPVVAALGGTVRGVRDGVDDHLVRTDADRSAIAGRECGNGIVLTHPNGVETQYCHMRKGSVSVKAGQRVEAGAKLGEIGASGLAQFPHVHLSVRVGGRKIDPVSGRELSGGCAGAAALSQSLFAPEAAAAFSPSATAVIGMGIAAAPVDFGSLVETGAPATPAAGGSATLVWTWLINVRAGDVVHSTMTAPDGTMFFEGDARPLERAKATYLSFAGRKRPLAAGTWRLTTEVRRDGAPVLKETRSVEVR